MKFLCDAMLGGLAKWLRAAGYDAYYAREGTDIADAHLVRLAIEERRVLLTGYRGFLEHKPVRDGEVAFLLVPHTPVEEQLRLVVERFGLGRRPSRCMECNGELEIVSLDGVADRVPPGVAREHETFFRYLGCGRVFWHGSHWARIVSNGPSGARVVPDPATLQRRRREVPLLAGEPPVHLRRGRGHA